MMSRKWKPGISINIIVFPLVATLTLAVVSANRRCKVFFDEVQVVAPTAKTKNWDLVVPFHNYFGMLFFWKPINAVGHKRCPHLSPNLCPSPLQLFHNLSDQLFWVGVADVCGHSLESIPDAH